MVAEVVPLGLDRPHDYQDAGVVYLRSARIAESSKRTYRILLSTWAWLAAGQQPPPVPFALLDGPAAAEVSAAAFAVRVATTDADTANRELSAMKATITWWRQCGWLAGTRCWRSSDGPHRRTDPGAEPRSDRCVVPGQDRRARQGAVEDAPRDVRAPRRSSPWTWRACCCPRSGRG